MVRRTIALALLATLALGSGCAKPDWIQQTLVTVDVTGTGGLPQVACSSSPWNNRDLGSRGPCNWWGYQV
jgi:hypothetical protein